MSASRDQRFTRSSGHIPGAGPKYSTASKASHGTEMVSFNEGSSQQNSQMLPEFGGNSLSRRFFIGAMPHTMLSVPDGVWETTRREDEVDDNSAIYRAMDNHAFHFFSRQGGKPEDWNDNTKARIRADLIRRWKESDWIRPLQHQSRTADYAKRWSGHTFEIGDILGVSILDKHAPQPSNITVAAQGPDRGTYAPASSMARNSYATAPSGSPLLSVGSDRAVSSTSSGLPGASRSEVYSSSTALLPPNMSASALAEQPRTAARGLVPRSILKKSSLSRSQNDAVVQPTSVTERDTVHGVSTVNREAGRNVHYSAPEVDLLPSHDVPATPDDVLTRTGDTVVESSAGATIEADTSEPSTKDEIILRGKCASVD